MSAHGGIIEVPSAMSSSERDKLSALGWVVVYNPLIKASHIIVPAPKGGEFHMDYIDADHIRLTPRRLPHGDSK